MDRQFAKIMRKMVVTRMTSSSFSLWEPPADLYETESELVVYMEVAGIVTKHIRIMVEPKKLIIKGVRKCPVDSISTVHQLEIEYGRFSREFLLPKAIDTGGVTSECQKGLLLVSMPLLEIQNTVEIFVK